MHADIHRKAAFDTLLLYFDNIRNAMAAFSKACEDPRLTAPARSEFAAVERSPELGISFNSMCSSLENHLPNFQRFECDLQSDLQRGVALLKRIRNYSFDLVPIHSLPHELIANIFLLLPTYGDDPGDVRQPDTVSHVCHSWRMIALGIPKLWSCIGFHGRFEDIFERVPRWMVRSGDCPIELHASAAWFEVFNTRSRLYLDLAFESYPRWRSLIIEYPESEPNPNFHRGIVDFVTRCGSLPPQDTLETIELWGITIDREDLEHFMTNISTRIIRLKTLSLHLRLPIPAFSFLPATITTLCLYGPVHLSRFEFNITPMQFSEILVACSGLENLTMDSLCPQPPLDDQILSPTLEAIVFANLRILRLSRLTNQQWMQFFARVKAPRLEKLFLTFHDTSRIYDAPPASFFQNFCGSLLQFELQDDLGIFWCLDPQTQQPHFISILGVLPLIQVLSIRSFRHSIPESIFIGLAATSNGQICPMLRRHLRITGFLPFPPQKLVATLRPRFISQPLDVLSIDCTTTLHILQDLVPRRAKAAEIATALERVRWGTVGFAREVDWKFRVDGSRW